MHIENFTYNFRDFQTLGNLVMNSSNLGQKSQFLKYNHISVSMLISTY